VYKPGWSVIEGILHNAHGSDSDWIASTVDVPTIPFSFEIRVKIVDGKRFRLFFDPNFWLGNEGDARQFEIYGKDLKDVRRVSDQSYQTGQWYTLRVIVDAEGQVSFFKNDVLSYTGTWSNHRLSNSPGVQSHKIKIAVGDGYSEGHIEISSIRLSHQVLKPVPATPSAVSSQTPVSILDTFDHGPLAGLWTLKPNGGSILKRGEELAFLPSKAQDSFGVMTSREGALPADSSWIIKTRFRYPHSGPYGVGLGVQTVATPKKQILFFTPAAYAFKGQVHHLSNPEQWHDLIITNNRGHWSVKVDGQQIDDTDVPKDEYELYFGNDVQHLGSWDWSTLALQFVQIDYSEGPRPEWLASLLKAHSTVIGQAAPTPSSEAKGVERAPVGQAKIFSIGLMLGVDSRIPPPAYPAPDGHLVVTSNNASVQVTQGSIVEFKPQCNRPGYVPDQLTLFVNRWVIERKDLFVGKNKTLPSFVVDSPRATGLISQVSIMAEDNNRRQVELSKATLRCALPEVGTNFVLQDERVHLNRTKEQTPKAIYLFLEDQYIGCLKGNLDSFAVDARHLPVGQHRFWLITEMPDSTLLPPTASTITILPRFRVSSFAQEGTFTVEAEKQAIPVHISRETGTGINKTFVYVAGAFVGESDKNDFDMSVSVAEVSSGSAAIEVVGVGKDGTLYPPESIRVNIKNIYTDSLAASNQKYKNLQTAIARINQIDQEIEYWYTRACNEPDFITFASGRQVIFYDGFARVASVSYLNSITVPGRVADYLGQCKAAIMKRASVRLEIGRLYKQLGKRDAARSTLQQVVREAGEDSGTGGAALQELRNL
jgi:hypothetical protein